MADTRAFWRFYLCGREAAEEDFDPGDFDLQELATQILEGADLRDTLSKAVTASMSTMDFDGSIADFITDYDEQLTEATGIDVDQLSARASRTPVRDCWKEWRRGFVDEATLELEDEVVEEMDEILRDEDDEDDHKPRKNSAGYGAFGRQGTTDAVNSWEEDGMEEYVDAVVTAAKALPARRRKDKLPELAQIEAEHAQVDAEATGSKDAWMDQNASDAEIDNLDPEVAYTDFWRPAYVSQTAKMLAERAADKI